MSESREFGLLRLPGQILFGSGSRESLPVLAASLGQRVFVCCDPFMAATEDFRVVRDGMVAVGLDVSVYTDIVPELPVESVQIASAASHAFGPDLIVGYGGGSAIDLAKLVALLQVHAGPLSEYYGENRIPTPVLPLIAVPTTAGTGSEVTPVAVVSDSGREFKVGVSSPYLIPRHAIVDPELTLAVPATVTAHSGIDAFVHAVESFTASAHRPAWVSKLPVFVGRNALSSLLGLEAIRLIGGNLRTAVREPQSQKARESMAYGSLLAGMAFGTAGTHLSHALQYPIGALSHTPHGLGTGLLLPYVLQACLPFAEHELAIVGEALGVAGVTEAARARAAIAEIRLLVSDVCIPRTLTEIGIAHTQLPGIAALAMTVSRLVNNAPMRVSETTMGTILTAALNGDCSGLPQ